MDRLNLYSIIFPAPASEKAAPVTDQWRLAYDVMDDLAGPAARRQLENYPAEDASLSALAGILFQSEQDIYLAWLLAALVPWRTAPLPPPGPKGQLQLPIPAVVVRDGLKVTNKVFEIVIRAFRNVDEVTTIRGKFTAAIKQAETPVEDIEEFSRESLGMAIRRWGSSWRMQVVLALLLDVVRTEDEDSQAG